MSREIVICHYNADLSWINQIDTDTLISIYDRSNNGFFTELPNVRIFREENVGREPKSFITHIINNYNNLRDYTWFLQDNPFPHGVTMEQIKKHPQKLFEYLGSYRHSCDERGLPHDNELPLKEISAALELNTAYPLHFTAGGQFVVESSQILKHKKSFYETANNMFDKHTKAPWAYERLWEVIFQ